MWTLARVLLADVGAQPRVERLEAELPRLEQPVDEREGVQRVGGDGQAVDGEKGVGGREVHPLVAVHEGMVLRQAFPKRRRLGEQVRVVAGLRPEQGGLEQPRVAQAGLPP